LRDLEGYRLLIHANFSAHFFGIADSGLASARVFLDRRFNAMNQTAHPSGDVRGSATPIQSVSRRGFLAVLLGFGSAVLGAALAVPLIRFALHPLVATTTKIGWSDVGKLDEFTSLTAPVKKVIQVEQRDAWRKIISDKPVYVMPPKDGLVRVLSPICPHLGCSIPWNEEKQEFICPCHAAVFDKNGALVSGPSPRAMDDLETKVENGVVQVRYQYFRQLIPQKEPLS